jgi:Xaa-Pro aminopeptidase
VLVPASIPHDAALYLEQAGYELESTTAVADARERKTEAELACLRRVQAVTCRGMARAEAVLAAAEPDGGDLMWEGEPLTTERLRRQVDAEMARYGVRSAGNTVIGAGETAADLHYTGIDHIAPGETVLLDISPRGPHGYYGDLTRTFVVDSEGGWERRAFVAVEEAHAMALDHVEAGVEAGVVHEEAAAELAAHGFRVDSSEIGFTHGVGHGVGVSLHEGPSLTGADELRPGHVVTIEPGVYDPEQGGVRIEDLVVVTEDGYEKLASYPVRFTPESAE